MLCRTRGLLRRTTRAFLVVLFLFDLLDPSLVDPTPSRLDPSLVDPTPLAVRHGSPANAGIGTAYLSFRVPGTPLAVTQT
jgi:hypothetical protein